MVDFGSTGDDANVGLLKSDICAEGAARDLAAVAAVAERFLERLTGSRDADVAAAASSFI